MPTAPPPTRDAALETRFFWERHKTEIVAVLLLALLGTIGYGGYQFYSERREAAAARMLSHAHTADDYQQVSSRFANTAAGANAMLLLADAQRQQRKFAEANTTLQKFIAEYPKHELVASAWMAVAGNYESMGNNDEALATYHRTAAAFPKDFNAPLALLSQARLLKAKNKPEDARLVCEKILTDYRDSLWAREAARQLRSLQPPPAPVNPAQSPAPSAAAGANAQAPQLPPLLARPSGAPLPSAPPQPKKP